MRHVLRSIVLLAGLAMPAHADESAIRSVISQQIDAFLDSDLKEAFTYASPTIRSRFGTPERFGAMVRSGYPMVWRPEDVQFLGAETVGGRFWQKVLVRDSEGTPFVLRYQMVETENGWKINAVRVERPPAGMV
ncbi:DUF4864 domain-containing protein [Roseovarius salinarum]|uniref:DUF4864 domain-containing protein n=1 Tax=Roseovarius salinarum TaxID=1981892 RepID=UPI000C33E10E|nr:DUF4864 domain-containing protein [Roseovarius salinarum]